ncbi:MAG: cupin domain-containing protein, partial [Elusimicrobiota bacterium]
MKKTTFLLLAASLLSAAAWLAADSLQGGAEFRLISSFDWKPATHLPPGAEYHLVREDPKTHGIQAVVRFPSGYAVPEHSHETDETIVILSGKLQVKSGGREEALDSGSYAVFPAGTRHSMSVPGWGKVLFLAATDGPYDLKASTSR